MIKNNITVFIEVFNEEARLASCLRSFSWADELVVFNKQSTDKTREIALLFATEVIDIEYSDNSNEAIDIINKRVTSKWILFPTASSLMHPKLAQEIIKLTSSDDFNYDVVSVPLSMYAFGILSPNSPWYGKRKNILIRKSALKLSYKIHNEIGFFGNNIYDMPIIHPDEVLYHCTHKDVDDFLIRHMRYTKREALYLPTTERTKNLRYAFFEVIKATLYVLVKRRSFLIGWDGIALSLAYISYYIMKYLYIWESNRENGEIVYEKIRSKIDSLIKKN